VLSDRHLAEELELTGWPLRGLRLMLRFVAPAVIALATVMSLVD